MGPVKLTEDTLGPHYCTAVTKMPADWDPSLPPVDLLVDEMTTLGSRAAAAIVAIDRSTVMRWTKQDLSPVSGADAVAQSIIVDGLTQIVPGNSDFLVACGIDSISVSPDSFVAVKQTCGVAQSGRPIADQTNRRRLASMASGRVGSHQPQPVRGTTKNSCSFRECGVG